MMSVLTPIWFDRWGKGYDGFKLLFGASLEFKRATVLGLVLCAGLRAQTDLINTGAPELLDAGKPLQVITLSIDGKLGSVGTRDGGVGIFDVGPATNLRWVAHHRKRVNAVVFNRAASLLASASDDGTINLVSLPSGRVSVLRGHKHKVQALAFSPDGQLLASGGEDKELILWGPSTGTEDYRLERSARRPVKFLAFGSSGTTLLAVDEGGLISEWDTKNRSLLRQYEGSDKRIFCSATSPSAKYLAIGTEFSALQKGAGGRATGKTGDVQGDTRDINREVLSGTSTTNVLVNPEAIRPTDVYRVDRIRIFDVDKGALAKTLDDINGEVDSISISADNRYIGLVRARATDTYLSVYDIQRGVEVASLPVPRRTSAVSFSGDGQWLASASEEGAIRIYAVRGIRPGGEVGDIEGVKYLVTSSQGGSIIPPNAKLIIAVMDFEPSGVEDGVAKGIADLLRTRILGSGGVRLIERSKMEMIIKEQNFSNSNRADPVTAAKLGRLLSAGKMIFGRVSKVGTSITIHTEMVDVETSKIDGTCEVLCQQCTVDDLPEGVARLKRALVADSP